MIKIKNYSITEICVHYIECLVLNQYSSFSRKFLFVIKISPVCMKGTLYEMGMTFLKMHSLKIDDFDLEFDGTLFKLDMYVVERTFSFI